MLAASMREVFRGCPLALRRILERVNRGRVVRRRLGGEAGGRRVYVSPEGALIWALPWATGDLDAALTEFCRQFVRPGSTIWDFGAHLGIFSFTAAHFSGPKGYVLAVEPDPFLSRLIIKSEEERPSSSAPVHVLTAAVSRVAGFATMEVAERSRAANALAGKSESTVKGGVRTSFEVLLVTGNQLSEKYPTPDLVKMDIEGSELDALIGGEEFFRKCRPVFFLEIFANIQKETSALFKSWGYRLYDAEVSKNRRTPLALAANNTIAIPG